MRIENFEHIRWQNILRAPDPQLGGTPRHPSPYTSKVYGWCMVDFEMANKTNATPSQIDQLHLPILEDVLSSLPSGTPYELP